MNPLWFKAANIFASEGWFADMQPLAFMLYAP
jgi:hypothetical protein